MPAWRRTRCGFPHARHHGACLLLVTDMCSQAESCNGGVCGLRQDMKDSELLLLFCSYTPFSSNHGVHVARNKEHALVAAVS